MKFFIPTTLTLLSVAAGQMTPMPFEWESGVGQSIEQPLSQAKGSVIHVGDPRFLPQAEVLALSLRKLGATESRVVRNPSEPHTIAFRFQGDLEPASYRIEVTGNRVTVDASSSQGAAHATATIVQMAVFEDAIPHWPNGTVLDKPSLPYRSFMVDMGRNPHSPETLRRVIDMMWFFKANYLQLHLTDDQLFSWPSKAFPKLYDERAGWAWSDFVRLEAYSQARGVTIIPELDVPGHSTLLRKKYPEVFGKTTTYLATQESARRGVEILIAEMLSVFRSTPYMHIGGDEAYGVPQEAQRDFINHLNAFVKKQGKRTVVWEGPELGLGTNKVDTDVIHINWRTIEFPAQEMLDAGYEIVNASWDPMYIVDHYPRTMFTAVSLDRCFDWDLQRFAHINHEIRTFAVPERTSTAAGILGFCMPWWEGREENIFALCLPRLAAVSARAWNQNDQRDFEGFYRDYFAQLENLQTLSGIVLEEFPHAESGQKGNLAFRGVVVATQGQAQPHFGPERLTNGITERFDHFLGFPTQPNPLVIEIQLPEASVARRIVIYETAVGESYEVYDLFGSFDGQAFEKIGEARKGARGANAFVEHRFLPRVLHSIRIETQGCHGLTFPSFSRLTEVMAFAD